MENERDHAVGRGLLRAELRQAREAVGFTQRDVADKLGWSPSKVIRIESGHVGLSPTDTAALLRLYEVTDEAHIGRLVSMARESRRSPWSRYRAAFHADLINFFGYEESAVEARYFEPQVVPGIIQGDEYSRCLIESFSAGVDPELTRLRIEARQARSHLLDRADPPRLTFVIAEAALHALVGSPGSRPAQREQLTLLLELNQLPHVDIYVLPFSFGSHPGMAGGFALLRLVDSAHGEILYEEMKRPSTTIGPRPEVEEARRLYDRLLAGSVGGPLLREVVEPILASLSGD